MGIINITNLNDGINVKSDPSAISDGGVQDAIGFDFTEEGTIKSAGGLAANDIAIYLPSGSIQCFAIEYIASTRYVLVTTEIGLYANGVLVQAGFSGRFKCASFINNIYISNGILSVRFDGTSCYQWGITPPTTLPVIGAGTYLSTLIDDFETLATWITNEVDCIIAAEATIKKEDTQSAKFTVAASKTGYSYVPKVVDLTVFSTGRDSSDADYIRFWLYVDNYINLDAINILFDVGDGSFESDFYSYTLASPVADSGLQSLGFGASFNQLSQDTLDYNTLSDPYSQTGYYDANGKWVSAIQSKTTKTISLKTVTQGQLVPPKITNQSLNYWTKSDIFQLQSGAWKEIKIPKSLFQQHGDFSKGWNTIAAVKIEVVTNASGTVNAYFDGLKIVGGSDLVGYYWFMYSWARMDSNNNVIHESAASRGSNYQWNITGPFYFDRNPLTYTARPLSSDPQVNGAILSCIGGTLDDFYVIAEIVDNTTVADTLYDIGESFVTRRLCSKSNNPAPPMLDFLISQNKIWGVGNPNYPRLIQSSDILTDGTLAPEGWPTRNAYDLEGNSGSLYNIRLINKLPIVKGDSGEWFVQIIDPTDYSQVHARRISTLGLLGIDAVVDFETSNVYPSPNGFVESDGSTSRFILPEIQPLIDNNISKAIGINAGLVSYFTYTTTEYGDRTAKIDLFRGKPRFTNLDDKLYTWLVYDRKLNAVYGVYNNNVYLIDRGSADESTSSRELTALLKSKVYRAENLVAWNRFEMSYNTGGIWYRLEVYIDGIFICSMPFMSTVRTKTNFRDFGPISGTDFQFIIKGNYTQPSQIFFPIRIYHGGK